jgi:hypothetical protein
MRRLVLLLLMPLALGGCVARTLVNVATAPVRVASKGIDLVTTSQAEADQKRGRELRKLEERYGKLERDWRKADRRCSDGSSQTCLERDTIAAEMDRIRPLLPAPVPD